MSATVIVALKTIAVELLSNKEARKEGYVVLTFGFAN